MAKLYFYFSAMNAGKSTALLQSNYNYSERGMKTIILSPSIDNRYGTCKVTSRIGLQENAIPITTELSILNLIKKELSVTDNLACVLVDEAQFLTKKNIKDLCEAVDKLNIPILTYGLRTNYLGEPFVGSQYLLAWADQIIELKTICHCGKKATMNMLVDDHGIQIKQGPCIVIGEDNRYVSVCRYHFNLGVSGPLK